MDIASLEYQEVKTPAEIAHDIDWLVSLACNPPESLKMTDFETGELKGLFVNMLEALHVTKNCGLEPVQIEAYILRRGGMSLRKTGRKLHIGKTTVSEYCRSVRLYARDYLASISD
jgi:hypothetical protein